MRSSFDMVTYHVFENISQYNKFCLDITLGFYLEDIYTDADFDGKQVLHCYNLNYAKCLINNYNSKKITEMDFNLHKKRHIDFLKKRLFINIDTILNIYNLTQPEKDENEIFVSKEEKEYNENLKTPKETTYSRFTGSKLKENFHKRSQLEVDILYSLYLKKMENIRKKISFLKTHYVVYHTNLDTNPYYVEILIKRNNYVIYHEIIETGYADYMGISEDNLYCTNLKNRNVFLKMDEKYLFDYNEANKITLDQYLDEIRIITKRIMKEMEIPRYVIEYLRDNNSVYSKKETKN